MDQSKIPVFKTLHGNTDLNYIEDANERAEWAKDSINVAVKQVQGLQSCAKIPSIFMVYSEDSIIGIGSGPLKCFCEDPDVVEKFKYYLHNSPEESVIESEENINQSNELDDLLCKKAGNDPCLSDVFEKSSDIEEVVISENIPPHLVDIDIERNITLSTKWTPLAIAHPDNPQDATDLAVTLCDGDILLKNDLQTNDNDLTWYPSYEAFASGLTLYEKENMQRFNIIRETKSFSQNNCALEYLSENLNPLIRWESKHPDDNLHIPFTGHPFISLGRRDYQCHQGADKNISSKMKQLKAKCKNTKSRKLTLTTKKMNCPVRFSVKKLMIFLNMKIPKDTRHRRSNMANKLKEILALPDVPNELLEAKLVYVLKFPQNTQHNNHLKDEELPKTLDCRVEDFIRALVRNGCSSNKDLESRAKHFVENYLAQDAALNHPFHEFFPSQQKIRNIKYSERRKMGLSNETEQNNDQSGQHI